jgi:hypothetical protein
MCVDRRQAEVCGRLTVCKEMFMNSIKPSASNRWGWFRKWIGGLGLLSMLSFGQAAAGEPEYARTTPAASLPAAGIDQLRELLLMQQKAIDELRLAVARQQRQIEALQMQVTGGTAATAVGAAERAATQQVASLAPAMTGASLKAQAPTTAGGIEEKPAPQALTVAGFRFSGDMRIRFDSVQRSATPVFGAVHNVRPRYRFRWNTDKDLHRSLSFHLQLASGAMNTGLTSNQDFTSFGVRHPFSISEAWVDYHPQSSLSVRLGRVEPAFLDYTPFLYDDELRLSGATERWAVYSDAEGANTVELRAGQYNLTNPNLATIPPGHPLASAGQKVGTQARAAQLYHQGLVLKTTMQSGLVQNTFFDIQLYRNPNQIALASTKEGYPVLLNPGIGIDLSGPFPGTGSALRSPGGAMFWAPHYQVARIGHEIVTSFRWRGRTMPLNLFLQVSRNVGTAKLRDAMMASIATGRIEKRGDLRLMYLFSIKDANSMVSQITEEDLGTGSSVNIRAHHIRVDVGLFRNVSWINAAYLVGARRPSNPQESFYVPIPRGAGELVRVQTGLEFKF